MSMSFNRLKQCLERSNVHCPDVELILERARAIRSAGPEKIQVLSDFDHTLTCHTVNGVEGATSHGVIERGTQMPKSFIEAAQSLRDKYFPIEHCHLRSYEEKFAAMEEWWHAIHGLVVEQKLTRESLYTLLEESNLSFRDSQRKLFCLLEENDVPLTVFSAGLADIIYIALESLSYSPKNLSVIGNKMIFDEQGFVTGFRDPVIHSYNKGMTSLKDYPHLTETLKGRTNVILLGDSQGDPYMARGLPDVENIVKIGFLNHKEEDLLPIYEQLYDIVLLGSVSTLEVPLTLLESILQ